MMPHRWSRWMPVIITMALVLTVFSVAAFAQSDEETRKKMADQTFFDVYVLGGGVIGICILLMDMVMWALAIQYFVTMRRVKLIPPGLLSELEDLFEEEQFEEALVVCEEDSCALAKVMAATLPKMSYGYDAMTEAFASAVDSETLSLNQHVAWLNLIAATAPMMGLFGTVTGMIGAFNTIAVKPNVSAAALAGDISIALVTTTQGLFVAIPAIILYFYFSNKVIKLSSEVATVVEDFIVRFRDEE